MKGNYLTICEDCGNRFFSDKAKEQLATHKQACEPYQSSLAEQAKARPAPEPVADEPEYQPPDAERRKKAAQKKG